MSNFFFQHPRHQIRHCPHTLADLGFSLHTTGEPNVYIVIFVSFDPARSLHLGLWNHGAGSHAGMNFIASAIEKSGVDKNHSVTRNADAFLKIDSSATFLIHDPDFDSVGIEPQQGFDSCKQVAGEADLIRAMHFRFDDIDTAGA